MAHPDNRILFGENKWKNNKKRDQLWSHKKVGRNFQCTLLSESSQSDQITYYMIPTMWLSGKEKIIDTVKKTKEKDQSLPGFKAEGGMKRWRTEDF